MPSILAAYQSRTPTSRSERTIRLDTDSRRRGAERGPAADAVRVQLGVDDDLDVARWGDFDDGYAHGRAAALSPNDEGGAASDFILDLEEGDPDDVPEQVYAGGHSERVTEEELAVAERGPAAAAAAARLARHLERHQGDADLVRHLAESDFAGKQYDRFAEVVSGYAVQVVKAWMITGQIFTKSAARGNQIGTRPQYWTEHDITGLACEPSPSHCKSSGRRRSAEEAGAQAWAPASRPTS
jgi:hypothetical protein